MIHIIKNYIWVITTSLLCIVFGLLTFFTFTNQSFTTLNNSNLQLLLIVDSILLLAFLLYAKIIYCQNFEDDDYSFEDYERQTYFQFNENGLRSLMEKNCLN